MFQILHTSVIHETQLFVIINLLFKKVT